MEDGSGFENSFVKRKNAQFRQGNKISVASSPLAVVYPVRLLLLVLRIFTGGSEDLHVFRGFNGWLVAKSPEKTVPGPDRITYVKYLGF
jgi:hypothetical protein